MKVSAIVLFVVVAAAQSAVVPQWQKNFYLRDRIELYPREQVPQTARYYVGPPQPITKDFSGVCGSSTSNKGDADAKIVGGQEASPHEFPWQVALTIDGIYFCGGSLISDEWVLTAAHCVDGAHLVNVLMGAHDRQQVETTQKSVLIKDPTNFIVNDAWNSNTLAGDLALIKLPTPVNFTSAIQPVCIAPTSESDHAGDTMTVSGWGKDSDDVTATVTTKLNKVDVVGITNILCRETYGSSIITDAILCASTTGGKGTCNGDSGGPLVYENVAGRKDQVGIVSFGANDGCELGYPVAFTRVSSHTDWITKVTAGTQINNSNVATSLPKHKIFLSLLPILFQMSIAHR